MMAVCRLKNEETICSVQEAGIPRTKRDPGCHPRLRLRLWRSLDSHRQQDHIRRPMKLECDAHKGRQVQRCLLQGDQAWVAGRHPFSLLLVPLTFRLRLPTLNHNQWTIISGSTLIDTEVCPRDCQSVSQSIQVDNQY